MEWLNLDRKEFDKIMKNLVIPEYVNFFIPVSDEKWYYGFSACTGANSEILSYSEFITNLSAEFKFITSHYTNIFEGKQLPFTIYSYIEKEMQLLTEESYPYIITTPNVILMITEDLENAPKQFKRMLELDKQTQIDATNTAVEETSRNAKNVQSNIEIQILLDLARQTRKSISPVTIIESDTLGFQIEDGAIIGLGLYMAKDLIYAPLTVFPETITQLTNLQYLNLNANQIPKLPDSISQLTKLEVLNLEENPLRILPESIPNLRNLQKLNLRETGLSILPSSIVQLKNLQNLNLAFNRFIIFPERIIQLSNLKKLVLSYNKLSTLPESITQLLNLKHLNLGGNTFEPFPEIVTQLYNLQELGLQDIQLITLPKSITNLRNLKSLVLSYNKIELFPEIMPQLTNLRELIWITINGQFFPRQ